VSDVVKIAMYNITKNNPYSIDDLHILLQVHDELVVEIREDLAEEGGRFVVYEMEKAFQSFLGKIPAVADLNIGNEWSKG
jgi:DNA polymerase-1